MKRFLKFMKSEVGDLQSPKKDADRDTLPEIDYKAPKPLTYNGKVVNSQNELKDLIKFDSFEEVIYGKIAKIRERENEYEMPEADRDPANKIDPKFYNLVQECRPVGTYYDSTLGDRLLFLKRIDGLSYDILEEHSKKKED